MPSSIPIARKRTVRPLRLLMVDDNPHDRELATRALTQQFSPLTVICARDASEFARTLTYGDFDAAIIDYEVKWTTGSEVLRRIKSSRPDCPVVMFTASASTEIAVEAMKEGLDDYITKTPKHYARLPYALEACLDRVDQRRELAQAQKDRVVLSTQVAAGRQRLQFALDSAGLIAWEVQLPTQSLHLSPNASTILGSQWTSLSQAIAAVSPADLPRVKAAFENAVKTSKAFTCELSFMRLPDSREVWLEVRGRPIRGASGAIVAAAGIAADITERRTGEVARAQLAALVESSDDAIIAATPEGLVTSWNVAAALLFGYSSEEIVGQSVEKIIPTDLRDQAIAVRRRVVNGERVAHYEANRVAKNGRSIPVSVRMSPMFDRAGSITGVSQIVRDITERKRAEEALHLAERRKDEFLATLAHELRNPLAPIRYATKLLEPGVPPEMADDAKRMINRQLAQMARLLDDLFDASRVTRGVLEISHEQLDTRAIIESAVASVRPLIEAAHQELAVTLPAEPLPVVGDAVRLGQVLGNLLHNATKYTPPGGHIAVTASLVGNEISVSIKDDGIGIAPEDLPTIFELFVRINAGGSRTSGGLGIGLSLARDLVWLHRGQIEAHSGGAGLGSEFVVRLPRTEETRALTEPVAAPEKVAVLGASGVRVLIVDDNVDAATSLSHVLTLAGYQTSIGHDGNQALELAEKLRPAVVLLDIGLPGLSGHELARRLRATTWGRDLRLIAITGWGQESDRAKSLEAGFDTHLTKPVDPEALLQHVARAAQSVA